MDAGAHAYEVLQKVANNVAATHNAHIEIMPDAGLLAIPVINDEKLALQAQASIEDVFPGHLAHNVNWYASELFANYGEIAPYVFTFVGIRNEELGSGAEHHNEYFDMDDDALKYAIGTMTKFAVDYLTT